MLKFTVPLFLVLALGCNGTSLESTSPAVPDYSGGALTHEHAKAEVVVEKPVAMLLVRVGRRGYSISPLVWYSSDEGALLANKEVDRYFPQPFQRAAGVPREQVDEFLLTQALGEVRKVSSPKAYYGHGTSLFTFWQADGTSETHVLDLASMRLVFASLRGLIPQGSYFPRYLLNVGATKYEEYSHVGSSP